MALNANHLRMGGGAKAAVAPTHGEDYTFKKLKF